jgi:exopolyphosphatase/guanosine-5'-triphosphate,3'-diphosphate pyrophosphatase
MAGAAPGLTAAVIDVGSNSVLLLVAHVAPDGRARQLDAALATTRLGTGLRAGGPLDGEAAARTGEAVVAFARRARAAGATRVWAYATGAARAAADGPAFTAALSARAGCPVAILSAADEARLAWEAIAAGAGAGVPALLAVDVGGATTELTRGRGGAVTGAISLPLGPLVLTERHVAGDPPAPAEAATVAAHIARALTDAASLCGPPVPRVVASGGTASALGMLDAGLAAYDPRRVHGHVVPRARLEALRDALWAMPAAERARRAPLDPGRARILPAGVAVLAAVVAAAGADALVVSELAVRHAYLRAQLAAEGVACDVGGLWS